MTTATEARTTPLHSFHAEHGGKFVEFAGWSMPMTYAWPTGGGGVHDEHKQTRTSGGFFDVSHMGRVYISGVGARRLCEYAKCDFLGEHQMSNRRMALYAMNRPV